MLNICRSKDAGHEVMVARAEGAKSHPPVLQMDEPSPQEVKGLEQSHPEGPDQGWTWTQPGPPPPPCLPAPRQNRPAHASVANMAARRLSCQ